MKLAMIGFGQAGGKIVDKFLEYDKRTGSGIVRAAVSPRRARTPRGRIGSSWRMT
jgi:cell division GTPase FtsZ